MRTPLTLALLTLIGACTPQTQQKSDRTPNNSQQITSTQETAQKQPHNVILFVADGLRGGMVSPDLTPHLASLQTKGVRFSKSHSIYPTLTMTNAASIATGHDPGDTSDFGNTLYTAYGIFDTGSFPSTSAGTFTPFIENNRVLGDLNVHFEPSGYLNEESLLSLARAQGYNTAALGKLGPTLLQDLALATPNAGVVPVPATIIVDDSTGKLGGLALTETFLQRLQKQGLSSTAPGRDNHAPGTSQDNGRSGDANSPGTLAANTEQQDYFVRLLTEAILPQFAEDAKPFVIVFWSRDPDGSQHNHGDSLGKIVPGINGPTSLAGIQNADANLGRILAALDAIPQLKDKTNVVVTADHGFSTISRQDLGEGQRIQSYSAGFTYKTAAGTVDIMSGHVPPGFLAIDLAHHLGLPLYDADTEISGQAGSLITVDPSQSRSSTNTQYPKAGNAILGGQGRLASLNDAKIVVTANGGSDLIYVPSQDPQLVRAIADFLASQNYVSGLFADDIYGTVPGALPLSAIHFKGKALLPVPSLVVNFRSFTSDSSQPSNHQVIVADTTLQQGQGMHGSFGIGDIFNFMAAQGPDFKQGYHDEAPVSNADWPVTLAHLLQLQSKHKGQLQGRVVEEALIGGPEQLPVLEETLQSTPATASKQITILKTSRVGDRKYLDSAGFDGRTLGLKP